MAYIYASEQGLAVPKFNTNVRKGKNEKKNNQFKNKMTTDPSFFPVVFPLGFHDAYIIII